MKPIHDSLEGTCMVQHNEAVYMIRKQIIERAKNFWKEAKEVNTNTVLGMS
jgi:hypothetical protein